ncbi:esterase/lipase family protein [Streptomyces qinzhouensis]|uniref:Alpha/beta fold hydrolase n=1 Tax=Streptomyces qinzhouensis TaxID=2599401 RepID=A0A5B8JB34_9ACTN|nr:alpha/beta fold hydrolase [Streptomyces qinzhouensis]QDY78607.1 alpha/beta fold hydrolase [Streptomyces qinzhouensis]
MQVLSFIPRNLGPLPGPDPRRTVEQLRELCELRLPATALRAHALELAILAGHLLLYPSGLTDERPAPPAAGSPPRPVIMLHGFVDNRSVFVLLRRSLARHGWRDLQCLNYSPLTCDIRAAAQLLGRHVEEVCARTGRDGVDLVGHSLGGLIARYYSQCLGGDLRVRNVVTLGTPHSGTRVAPLASAHPIVRQMRPDSPVIEELRRPAPGCRTRFISFWSELDQLMDPVETARIDHPDLCTENVRVTGIGHLALPVHPAVAARIRAVLGAADGVPVPSSVIGEPVAVA